jgi:putative endonuclease
MIRDTGTSSNHIEVPGLRSFPHGGNSLRPGRRSILLRCGRQRASGSTFSRVAKRGALYIGVTNDIARRIFDHREGRGSAHVRTYQIFLSVHIEEYETAIEAIAREKQLKKWRRDWKIALIESDNPDWIDLYELLNA